MARLPDEMVARIKQEVSLDPNGNRTQDAFKLGRWVYDSNDRLQSGPQASYGYDLAGHTVSKTEGGVTTHCRYNA